MRQNTRLKFNQMCDKLAASYGVPSMNVQFAVEPTLQQRLQDKIVEQSTFLPKINIVPVDELAGENVLGSASGPVSGRSDTTKDSVERVPRDVLGLVSYKYQLQADELRCVHALRDDGRMGQVPRYGGTLRPVCAGADCKR